MRSLINWLASIITQLWNTNWALWNHQNTYLHTQNQNLISLLTKRAIQVEFDQGFDGFSKQVRKLTNMSLSQVLLMNQNDQAVWLQRIKAYRKERDGLSQSQLEERRYADSLYRFRQNQARRRANLLATVGISPETSNAAFTRNAESLDPAPPAQADLIN